MATRLNPACSSRRTISPTGVALAQVTEPAHPQNETGNIHGLTLAPSTDTPPSAILRH